METRKRTKLKANKQEKPPYLYRYAWRNRAGHWVRGDARQTERKPLQIGRPVVQTIEIPVYDYKSLVDLNVSLSCMESGGGFGFTPKTKAQLEEMRAAGWLVVIKCMPKDRPWIIEGSHSEFDAPCPDKAVGKGKWCCEATHMDRLHGRTMALDDKPGTAIERVYHLARLYDKRFTREGKQR